VAVNDKVATVLGSIPASSNTVASEGRITYIKRKNRKIPLLKVREYTYLSLVLDGTQLSPIPRHLAKTKIQYTENHIVQTVLYKEREFRPYINFLSF
jgi:hypothetical protein